MSKIGVVAAITAEAACFFDDQRPAPRRIHHYRDFKVYVSGIGAARADAAAAILVADGVDALVSFGCAGALTEDMHPGDLILPESTLWASDETHSFDLKWHHRLYRECTKLCRTNSKPLVSADQPAATPACKRALRATTGAVAVDMESAAIARIARSARLPFACIRAIADPADLALPKSSLASIDPYGRTDFVELAKNLLWNPGDVFPMIMLGRAFRKALTTLTMVARIPALCFEPD